MRRLFILIVLLAFAMNALAAQERRNDNVRPNNNNERVRVNPTRVTPPVRNNRERATSTVERPRVNRNAIQTRNKNRRQVVIGPRFNRFNNPRFNRFNRFNSYYGGWAGNYYLGHRFIRVNPYGYYRIWIRWINTITRSA